MKSRTVNISLIVLLSTAFVVLGVFCCCFEKACAETMQTGKQQCCPLSGNKKVPESRQECKCRITQKFLIAEKSEPSWPTHVVLADTLQRISTLLLPDIQTISLADHHTLFSSDPPIYIRNSVYRL